VVTESGWRRKASAKLRTPSVGSHPEASAVKEALYGSHRDFVHLSESLSSLGFVGSSPVEVLLVAPGSFNGGQPVDRRLWTVHDRVARIDLVHVL
jgi:hypothetical protein